MKKTIHTPSKSKKGFALVSTIVILSLLMLVALAMTSLSSLVTRTSNVNKDLAIAEANARMALTIAIAEMQAELGDDRRITTPSSQQDTAIHQSLIAVYQSRTMEDELANSLDSSYYDRSTNFRRWLVSHPNESAVTTLDLALNGVFPDPVTLKSHENKPQLNLVASKISTQNGKYAWAVEDESLKARIDLEPQNYAQVADTLASQTMQTGLPTANGPQIHSNFKALDPKSDEMKKLFSDQVFQLLPNNTVPEDDLLLSVSTHPVTLLTDVKSGGLKKDLSMLLELSESDLPSEYRRLQNHSARHWGGSRGLNDQKFSDIHKPNGFDYDTLPISLIQNYYKFYKLGTNAAADYNDGTRTSLVNKRPALDILVNSNNGINEKHWRGYGHTFRLSPIVSRIRDVVWATAKETSPGSFDISFISFPIVTIWNPYNVKTTTPVLHMQYRSHPSDALVKVGTNSFKMNLGGRSIIAYGSYAGKPPIVLEPGESKVFFPDFANSTYAFMRMASEWPANINDITNFKGTTRKVNAPSNSSVEISVVPNSSGSYGLTHYNDGWISPSVGHWRNHKFHDWTFNLSKLWSSFDSGSKSLNSSLSELAARPRPVAVIDLGIKAANDLSQPSTVWNYDFPQKLSNRLLYQSIPSSNANPNVAEIRGARQAAQLAYSYIPLRGDTDLAKYLSTYEDNQGVHDFMGYSHNPAFGSSYLTMCELPFVPLRSLGQLQHIPLQDENWTHDDPVPISPTWSFTIGNSSAHPWLQTNELLENRYINLHDDWTKRFNGSYPMIDRLSVANSILFDSYYFSTLAPQDSPWFAQYGNTRSLAEVLTDAESGDTPLPNDRYRLSTGIPIDILKSTLLKDDNTPKQEAYKAISAYLSVHGGFNINSTSEDAWKIILASTFEAPVVEHSFEPLNNIIANKSKSYLISRFSHPNGPSIDHGGDPYTNGFNGYRELTGDHIEELAIAIVDEVKERGPFRSLSEFVNRQRTDDSSDKATLNGTIASALLNKKVTINDIYGTESFDKNDFPDAKFITPEALDGSRARGLPGYVNQADILTPLAPIMTCRGDTFTVRAYGESTGPNGVVLASAYCEAVIQRTIDFVDPSDSPDTALADLTSEANKKYGRKFIVKSFRWVHPREAQ